MLANFGSALAAASLVAGPAAQPQTATPPVAGTLAGHSPLTDQLGSIRDYLEAAAAEGRFSGAVIIAREGRPIFQGAYGLADRASGEPNRLDTRFNLASLGKLLTRIAILQLAQAGKVDLSAPVGRYLPAFPNVAVRERVTLQQLYDMRSGVGSYWNGAFADRRANIRTTDDYLSLFATDPLEFEPGTAEQYSNGGYIILGKIVETVSGQSFPDYVSERIAGPAGMADLGFFAIDERVPRLAVGYTTQRPAPTSSQSAAAARPAAGHLRSVVSDTLVPNTPLLPGRGQAAGGGYASARDLLMLDRALRQRKLLNAESTARLLGAKFEQGSGVGGFAGGYPGANTQLMMFGDGLTVIVLANLDPPAAVKAGGELAELLGKKVRVTR